MTRPPKPWHPAIQLAAIAVIIGVAYLFAYNADQDYKTKHDAVYNAIAAAHGWDPKHLSDDQDEAVEGETSDTLRDAQ